MTGRRGRAAVRVLLGLTAAATLVGGGAAAAQDAGSPSLAGFQGSAQADGFHAFYIPKGLLPIGPPVDLGVPDAYATIASGPATFARASAADPGDLVANPDALLASGAPGYQAGTVPAYPYRAVASSATQAEDESSPGPGLDARATADQHGSVALATMPASTTPAVATFGTLRSTATTTTDGATVTVHARSELSNLDVLGVLKVGSVITDVTATSNGTGVELSGGTVVTDASVLGTPVEIDAGGVTPSSPTTTTTGPLSGLLGSVLPPAAKSLNDVLGEAGIHVTVAGPVQNGDEKAGQLTAAGLRIDFELSDRTFPALKSLLDRVPPVPDLAPGAPTAGDLVALAEARHLVAFTVGRGVVSLSATASKPFTAKVVPPAAPKAAAAPAPATTGSSTAATARPAAPAAPSLVAAAPAPTVEAEPAAVSIGAGVGALVLLTLLAQPFAGSWLARGSAALLASDTATSCPWEER